MYSLCHFLKLINSHFFNNLSIVKWKTWHHSADHFLLFCQVSNEVLVPSIALSYINFHETGLSSNGWKKKLLYGCMNKENVKSFYHLCPLNNLWQLLENKKNKCFSLQASSGSHVSHVYCYLFWFLIWADGFSLASVLIILTQPGNFNLLMGESSLTCDDKIFNSGQQRLASG